MLMSPGAAKAASWIIGGLCVVASMWVARDVIKLKAISGAVSPASVQSPAEQKKPAAFEDYASVVEDNAFGIKGQRLERLSAPVQRDEPSEGRLEAKVFGTVAWPGGFGYAIVDSPQIGQNVYVPGEMIPSAGKLSRVYYDYIIVIRDGREVRLAIEETIGVPQSTARAEQSPAPARTPADFTRKTDSNAYVVDQSAIEQSLASPQQLMTDARLLPNFVNGTQEGFKMREVKPGGIYDSLGLRNGDILLSVNSFQLSDPATALQAFTALRGMNRIELQVKRDGENMTIKYDIR